VILFRRQRLEICHHCSCNEGEVNAGRTSMPSMRRPVPVKSSCCFHEFFSFSRSAKPPLSPPFHPHSYMSGFRSVQVGCSRFIRRCHLIIVLRFSLQERSLGPGTCRSRLNSAVELSCSVTNSFSARLLYAAAFITVIEIRHIDVVVGLARGANARNLVRCHR